MSVGALISAPEYHWHRLRLELHRQETGLPILVDRNNVLQGTVLASRKLTRFAVPNIQFIGEENLATLALAEWYFIVIGEILDPARGLFELVLGRGYRPQAHSRGTEPHMYLRYMQVAGKIFGRALIDGQAVGVTFDSVDSQLIKPFLGGVYAVVSRSVSWEMLRGMFALAAFTRRPLETTESDVTESETIMVEMTHKLQICSDLAPDFFDTPGDASSDGPWHVCRTIGDPQWLGRYVSRLSLASPYLLSLLHMAMTVNPHLNHRIQKTRFVSQDILSFLAEQEVVDVPLFMNQEGALLVVWRILIAALSEAHLQHGAGEFILGLLSDMAVLIAGRADRPIIKEFLSTDDDSPGGSPLRTIIAELSNLFLISNAVLPHMDRGTERVFNQLWNQLEGALSNILRHGYLTEASRFELFVLEPLVINYIVFSSRDCSI